MNISELPAEKIIAENESIRTLLSTKDREIEKLQNAILNANKKTFGSKSEKLSTEQIKFSFNQLPEPKQESLEKEIIVEKHTRVVKKGRNPLPDDLPREEIIYEPEDTHCSCCNHELVKIGEERSSELEKIPAQLKVIEHVRIKKACPACKGAGVLVPPLPPTAFPLERARPGAGLLADIIVSKYVDHLPLHRQEDIYRRLGIELPRQRMCDWVAGVTELLMPIYTALKKEILSLSYIQADETTLKVQDNKIEGKCHTGYLWGLHGPPSLVWFHYAETRSGKVIEEILEGFKGSVQTDFYAGYNQVFVPETCNRVACLAHVRRKFIEVQKTAGKECARILKYIADLYRLEKSVRTDEERGILRHTKSAKIMNDLFDYLHELNQRTLPQSLLAKAIKYTLNQEKEIRYILESPVFELDNNGIERQIRPVAIGRKNYMFAGSHDGAKRAAVLYSLLNTCKLNKVNPWEWLRDVMLRVSSDKSVTAADLLPHHWKIRFAVKTG